MIDLLYIVCAWGNPNILLWEDKRSSLNIETILLREHFYSDSGLCFKCMGAQLTQSYSFYLCREVAKKFAIGWKIDDDSGDYNQYEGEQCQWEMNLPPTNSDNWIKIHIYSDPMTTRTKPKMERRHTHTRQCREAGSKRPCPEVLPQMRIPWFHQKLLHQHQPQHHASSSRTRRPWEAISG